MATAWYKTGSVTVTNGSTTVSGTNTLFVAGSIKTGDVFVGPDKNIYEVATVVSDATITLAKSYSGSSASNQSYGIVRFLGTSIVSLASQIVDKTVKWEAITDQFADYMAMSASDVLTSPVAFTFGGVSYAQGQSLPAGHAVLSNTVGDYYLFKSPALLQWEIDSNAVKLTGDQTIDGSKSFAQNVGVNGGKLVVFAPNTFGAGMIIGGTGNRADATNSNISTTNGNVHIDPRNGGYATFLNYYSGGEGVKFGNGNGAVTAEMTSAGDLYKGGSVYWHAGNDGNGSGLDADMLDGLQSEQFIRSDVDNTATGVVTFGKKVIAKHSGSTTNIETFPHGTAPLEVQADGGDVALMQFHKPNKYGTHFGVDENNDFAFGGWSAGANSYKFWTERNFDPSNLALPINLNAAGGAVLDSGSDAAGLTTKNNLSIGTWYGFSIHPTISGFSVPVNAPAFSVDARTGRTYSHEASIGSNDSLGTLLVRNDVDGTNDIIMENRHGDSTNAGSMIKAYGFRDVNPHNYVGYMGFKHKGGSSGDLNQAVDIIFGTSPEGSSPPAERMRITNSGYVGIGTSDPSNKLTVEGGTGFDDSTATIAIRNVASEFGRAQLSIYGKTQSNNDSWNNPLYSRSGINFFRNYDNVDTGAQFALQHNLVSNCLGISTGNDAPAWQVNTQNRMLVNTSADNGIDSLQVNGSATFSNGITQFQGRTPCIASPTNSMDWNVLVHDPNHHIFNSLDDVVREGRYNFYHDGASNGNLVNSPGVGWFFMDVLTHSNKVDTAWVTQTVYPMGDNASYPVGTYWTRRKTSGTWSAWERFPHNIDTYNITGDVPVGTWVDTGITAATLGYDYLATYVVTVLADTYNAGGTQNYSTSYKFMLGCTPGTSNATARTPIQLLSYSGHAPNTENIELGWLHLPSGGSPKLQITTKNQPLTGLTGEGGRNLRVHTKKMF